MAKLVDEMRVPLRKNEDHLNMHFPARENCDRRLYFVENKFSCEGHLCRCGDARKDASLLACLASALVRRSAQSVSTLPVARPHAVHEPPEATCCGAAPVPRGLRTPAAGTARPCEAHRCCACCVADHTDQTSMLMCGGGGGEEIDPEAKKANDDVSLAAPRRSRALACRLAGTLADAPCLLRACAAPPAAG